MAKLVQFWYSRNGRTRGGITWAVVFLLLKVVFWYITQNVGFSNMSTATVVHYIDVSITVMGVLALLVAVAGLFAQLGEKRGPKPDAGMQMADGRRMIKK